MAKEPITATEVLRRQEEHFKKIRDAEEMMLQPILELILKLLK